MPNQGLQIQPLPIGQQGTATYKPNWGQPIVDGQWQGQPQATPAIDPRKIVSDRLGSLRADFKQRADTLKASGLDAGVHNRILAGWQDEYDQAKAELTGATSQLDLIQQQIGAGGMTQEAGREAAIRMIVPRETADLMFPSVRAEPRGRFTPSEFGSYVKEFQGRIESAVTKPWLARNYADPDMLKEQYFSARAAFAYDTDMNTDEQKGFDLAWDRAVSGNKLATTAWKKAMKEDPDLFTSRTYDARLLNIAAEKARGPVSPLARSVSKQTKKTTYPTMGAAYPTAGGWNPWVGQRSAGAKPRRQHNQKTGQTRVSYDGGRTWQIE